MNLQYRYGTLYRMMPERCYFFIRDDGTGEDIFAHVSGFINKLGLPKGTRVQFHLIPNPRKPGRTMAIDCEPIKATAVIS